MTCSSSDERSNNPHEIMIPDKIKNSSYKNHWSPCTDPRETIHGVWKAQNAVLSAELWPNIRVLHSHLHSTRNVQYAGLDKTKIVLMITCSSYFMCELWSFQSNTIKSLLCLESRYATIQISDKVSNFNFSYSRNSKQSYFFPPFPSKNWLQLCSLLTNQFRLTYENNPVSSQIKKFLLVVPSISLVPSVFITFKYLTTQLLILIWKKITFLWQLLRGDWNCHHDTSKLWCGYWVEWNSSCDHDRLKSFCYLNCNVHYKVALFCSHLFFFSFLLFLDGVGIGRGWDILPFGCFDKTYMIPGDFSLHPNTIFFSSTCPLDMSANSPSSYHVISAPFGQHQNILPCSSLYPSNVIS